MRKILSVVLLLSLLSVLLMSGCSGASKGTIETIAVNNEVPKVGPYSQMLRAGGFVFCTAQAAFDPQTGKLVSGGIEEQTERILENFTAELADAGLSMSDVVSVTVYLTDLTLFTKMNEVYARYFTEPYPVRACVEVTEIPVEGALLSIQLTALDK